MSFFGKWVFYSNVESKVTLIVYSGSSTSSLLAQKHWQAAASMSQEVANQLKGGGVTHNTVSETGFQLVTAQARSLMRPAPRLRKWSSLNRREMHKQGRAFHRILSSKEAKGPLNLMFTVSKQNPKVAVITNMSPVPAIHTEYPHSHDLSWAHLRVPPRGMDNKYFYYYHYRYFHSIDKPWMPKQRLPP